MPKSVAANAAAPSVPFHLTWFDAATNSLIEFRLRVIRELLRTDLEPAATVRLLFGHCETAGLVTTWHILNHETAATGDTGSLTAPSRDRLAAALSTGGSVFQLIGVCLRADRAAAPDVVRALLASGPVLKCTMLVLVLDPSGEVSAGFQEPSHRSINWTSLRFPASFEALQLQDYRPFQAFHTSDSRSALASTTLPYAPVPETIDGAEERVHVPFRSAPVAKVDAVTGAESRVTLDIRIPGWVWAGVILLLVVCLFGGAWWYLQRVYSGLVRNAEIPAAPAAGRTELGLQVNRRASDDLAISWNSQSPALRSATGGHLAISDGTERRYVSLTAEYVRAGQILYRPQSADIEITLAVFTAGGSLQEVVRIIGPHQTGSGTPVPTPRASWTERMPPESARSRSAAPSATQTPPAAPVRPAVTDTEIAAIPELRPLPELKLRPLPRQTSVSPAAEVKPKPQDDPPPLPGSVRAAVGPPPYIPEQVQPQAPPPPAQPHNADTKPPVPASGPKIQPPVAISPLQPHIPSSIRNMMRSDFVIVVTLNIGADGRVVSVDTQPAAGIEAVLIRLIKDAARGWRFRPALRDGVPVPSTQSIEFKFPYSRH